eukprot:927924-Rhodomonas_salina.1
MLYCYACAARCGVLRQAMLLRVVWGTEVGYGGTGELWEGLEGGFTQCMVRYPPTRCPVPP